MFMQIVGKKLVAVGLILALLAVPLGMPKNGKVFLPSAGCGTEVCDG
ncbi:MAG: hypothetical protein KAG66_24940 [Methylococcales bacterium]|nr:hypothetical protein [Methylococcales bacterium]